MVMANVKFRNIVHDQFLGVSVKQGSTVQYSTPVDHHWPLYESIWHLDSIFHVLPIPTEYAYILLCLYSSSTHIISCCAASALEVSTSLPRSSNSFWQLALSAESSPAQVAICWIGDVIMCSCVSHQEFITIRVCNSRMVSTPAIWIGWSRQSAVNMLIRYLTWSHSRC